MQVEFDALKFKQWINIDPSSIASYHSHIDDYKKRSFREFRVGDDVDAKDDMNEFVEAKIVEVDWDLAQVEKKNKKKS